jgi:hypothetical protein
MFRFTIRDVLWLTVVVAVSTGWLVSQSRIRDMQAEIERTRGDLAPLSEELEARQGQFKRERAKYVDALRQLEANRRPISN